MDTVSFEDYYEYFGIPVDATEKEIKKAYHRMSHSLHPDSFVGAPREVCEQKEKEWQHFQEIYEVLIDPEKREEYDTRRYLYYEELYQKHLEEEPEAPLSEDDSIYSGVEFETVEKPEPSEKVEEEEVSSHEEYGEFFSSEFNHFDFAEEFMEQKAKEAEVEEDSRFQEVWEKISSTSLQVSNWFIDRLAYGCAKVYTKTKEWQESYRIVRQKEKRCPFLLRTHVVVNQLEKKDSLSTGSFLKLFFPMEWAYHLKKLKVQKGDTPSIYVLRNRRKVIYPVLGIALIALLSRKEPETSFVELPLMNETTSVDASFDEVVSPTVEESNTLSTTVSMLPLEDCDLIRVYQVETGDTLSQIASSFDVDVEALARFNQLEDLDAIYPGEELHLSYHFDATKFEDSLYRISVTPQDSLDALANQYHTTVESLLLLNPGRISMVGDALTIEGETLFVPDFTMMEPNLDSQKVKTYS